MVNTFPHVHSFRLSDEDERYYKALMRRFHIYSPNQSVAFRKLLRAIQGVFSEMDDAKESQSLSVTQSDEDEELSPYGMEPDEDQGDDPDYERYRQEAAHRIVSRGRQPLTYENILAEVRAIKKEREAQS